MIEIICINKKGEEISCPPNAVNLTGKRITAHFLDVKTEATLIQTPDKKNVLIDAGESGQGDEVYNRFLKSMKIKRLDLMVASHPHEDHAAGFTDIFRRIKSGTLNNDGSRALFVDNGFDAVKKDGITLERWFKNYRDLRDELSKTKIIYKPILKPVQSLDFDSVAKLRFFLDEGFDKPIKDYLSLWLGVSYAQATFLFVGDNKKASEKRITAKYLTQLRADVLKVSEHGSSEATTDPFLDAVSPRIAIVLDRGVKTDPAGREAKIASLQTKRHLRVYRTSHRGTITVSSDGKRRDGAVAYFIETTN